MENSRSLIHFAAILATMMMVMISGCDEDDNPVDNTGDVQQVIIVVLANNTDTRVAGAHIIIDGDSNLSCETSGPGGDSGGECTFRLKKVQHSIKISKVGYSPLETTFQVTGNTTHKYFSLSN